MKALLALTLAVATLLLSVQGLRVYLENQASVNAQAAHVARAVALDARLADACAKHQTGVVLFYKGQHCAQGSN